MHGQSSLGVFGNNNHDKLEYLEFSDLEERSGSQSVYSLDQ